jgi:hypothetical protein
MELSGDPSGSRKWESYLITVPKSNTFAKKEAKKGANEYVKIFNSDLGNHGKPKGSRWILLRPYTFYVKV